VVGVDDGGQGDAGVEGGHHDVVHFVFNDVANLADITAQALFSISPFQYRFDGVLPTGVAVGGMGLELELELEYILIGNRGLQPSSSRAW
jgi:hypothetical protein